MNDTVKKSILEMARGGFLEQVNYEMAKVLDNPNTKATGKRRITVTMELTPDDSRRQIAVSFTTKLALIAANPLTTSLYVLGDDDNGDLCVVEMTPQIPGQMDLDGALQERPPQLKIIKIA